MSQNPPVTITEAERQTPVAEHCEVLVAGGGPAGIAAALAAGRQGVKTRLLEVHGALGGVWTSGLLSWIIDAADKPGIMGELIRELDRRGARRQRQPGGRNFAYDPEVMKILLEELCIGAGVAIQLHTRVVAAKVTQGRLTEVITESRSGRQAWRVNAAVDATGEGDLAARAGCEPSYSAPTLFCVHDDLFALMANHQYGVLATDAAGVTAATIRARAEIHQQVAALRALGPPWDKLRVVATGAQIGVREGRRIHGRHTVSLNDVLHGVSHEDAICRVTFGIDVHALDPHMTKDFDPANRQRTKPYDIPLRALLAKDVDGLLLAGRCISGDFFAHSSYRVTGNAVAMGEAAGLTAALATRLAVLPHEVPWSAVKTALEGRGGGAGQDAG